MPFRQLLDRHGYEISVSKLIGVSESVVMRRMTAVSPYPHWHYFDAYNPGKLKAVYRGNGIPLPWGNMRMVEDPCQHWSVFRMIGIPGNTPVAQISVLNQDGVPHIYCCESVKVKDMAGNYHVLCSGVDLNPALRSARGRCDCHPQVLSKKSACAKGINVNILIKHKQQLQQYVTEPSRLYSPVLLLCKI